MTNPRSPPPFTDLWFWLAVLERIRWWQQMLRDEIYDSW